MSQTPIIGILLAMASMVVTTCRALPDVHKHMSPQQLQSIFHIDNYEAIPDYEIIQLKHHTALSGIQHISHEAAYRRRRRSLRKLNKLDGNQEQQQQQQQQQQQSQKYENDEKELTAADHVTKSSSYTTIPITPTTLTTSTESILIPQHAYHHIKKDLSKSAYYSALKQKLSLKQNETIGNSVYNDNDNNNDNDNDNDNDDNDDANDNVDETEDPNDDSSNADILAAMRKKLQLKLKMKMKMKRKLKQNYHQPHKVSFDAFGKTLNLTLQRTKGLFKEDGPHTLPMWYIHPRANATNGLHLQKIEDEDSNSSDHIGEAYQDEENMAAILMRRHEVTGDLIMEGSIGHDLVITPLPHELSHDKDKSHHIIYKRDLHSTNHLSDFAFMEPDVTIKLQRNKRTIQRTTLDNLELEEEEEEQEKEQNVKYMDNMDDMINRKLWTSHKRIKRQAPYIIYPEILVIVDYDGYRLHGGDNLQVKRYFISFWNGVDLRYRLLKGPRIRISIAGIIISRGRDATPYLERNRVGRDAIDSAAALTDMGKYLFRERRLPVYDIAVAITKYDMCRRRKGGRCTKGTAGFAYVGGACVVNKRLEKVNSVAIIEDTGGFSGIIVAAHEVGHLLGAVHDGSPPPSYLGGPGAQRCHWEDGYIMSDLRHTERGFRWSPCTVQSFHHFLNGDTATCLHNAPHEDSALGRSLPGTLLSLDAQCRRDRGTYACFKDERVCAQLFCFDAQTGYCVAYRPAAEGSSCGDSLHCLDGRCTPLLTNAINYGPTKSSYNINANNASNRYGNNNGNNGNGNTDDIDDETNDDDNSSDDTNNDDHNNSSNNDDNDENNETIEKQKPNNNYAEKQQQQQQQHLQQQQKTLNLLSIKNSTAAVNSSYRFGAKSIQTKNDGTGTGPSSSSSSNSGSNSGSNGTSKNSHNTIITTVMPQSIHGITRNYNPTQAFFENYLKKLQILNNLAAANVDSTTKSNKYGRIVNKSRLNNRFNDNADDDNQHNNGNDNVNNNVHINYNNYNYNDNDNDNDDDDDNDNAATTQSPSVITIFKNEKTKKDTFDNQLLKRMINQSNFGISSSNSYSTTNSNHHINQNHNNTNMNRLYSHNAITTPTPTPTPTTIINIGKKKMKFIRETGRTHVTSPIAVHIATSIPTKMTKIVKTTKKFNDTSVSTIATVVAAPKTTTTTTTTIITPSTIVNTNYFTDHTNRSTFIAHKQQQQQQQQQKQQQLQQQLQKHITTATTSQIKFNTLEQKQNEQQTSTTMAATAATTTTTTRKPKIKKKQKLIRRLRTKPQQSLQQ